MKAPGFWYRPAGTLASLLTPLGLVYAAAGAVQRAIVSPWRAPIPVLCIGNLVAGGAGKTPLALALLNHLRSRGIVAHGLSRGYGGSESGPLLVNPTLHGADRVGDEPLLLAQAAPTWVARDRVAGARAAIATGAKALVLDDGFQNPALIKDLSLLVVDGAVGFGNGKVIPAGPLREPIAAGLARSQAVVVIGEDRTGVAALVERLTAGRVPVLNAYLRPEPAVVAELKGKRVLAFAGIGRPDKFFATCAALGAEIVESVPFPDHHRFLAQEIEALLARAERLAALAVTTTKDTVRLSPQLRERVRVVPVTLEWCDETDRTVLMHCLERF
ncbi:Tetraacyldisaccharide 4'-kinase [uncultured Gammaproteobacteria bacterium]